MSSSFSAQIKNFSEETKKKRDAIFKQSVQDTVDEIIDRTRVDTNFLRASFRGSASQMPVIRSGNVGASGGSYEYSGASVTLTIAGSRPGDTTFYGFTAAYALPRESKDGMVRLAAQNWQRNVRRNTARLARR